MADPVNIIVDIAELDRILKQREEEARREILVTIDEYLRLVFEVEIEADGRKVDKTKYQAARATRQMVNHICKLYNINYDFTFGVEKDGRPKT